MVAHSSMPAWRIPWTEELGGLLSVGVIKSRTRLSSSKVKDGVKEGMELHRFGIKSVL